MNLEDDATCRGVVVKHADSQYRGCVSSIPPCVAFETPLARKATGDHLMISASLEKNSEPCLWFLLRSKSSMQRSISLQVQLQRNRELSQLSGDLQGGAIFYNAQVSSSSVKSTGNKCSNQRGCFLVSNGD